MPVVSSLGHLALLLLLSLSLLAAAFLPFFAVVKCTAVSIYVRQGEHADDGDSLLTNIVSFSNHLP